MALSSSETHIPYNALVKPDLTLYWNSSLFLMWTKHGMYPWALQYTKVSSPHNALRNPAVQQVLHADTLPPVHCNCIKSPVFHKKLTPPCGEGRNVAPIMHQDYPVLQCMYGDALSPTMNPLLFQPMLHLLLCLDPECTRRPGLDALPGTAGTGALGDPIQVHGEVRPSSGALKLPRQLLQNRFHWAQPLQFAPQ